MSNDHCRKLSNSAYITSENNNVLFQPCCWIQPEKIDILNRPRLDGIRKIFIKKVEGNKEKFCKECFNREHLEYGKSDRQKIVDFVPKDALNNDIYDFSLQVDNTCNAACVMCGPHFSSLWEKQLDTKAKLKDFSEHYNKINNLDNWKNLTRVSIMGGEPLLSEHNFNFLRKIPEPQNVTLTFSTNGSIPIIDDSVKSLLVKFKKSVICFSIDGLEETFEYIRWPLNWNKVSKNIYDYITDDFQGKNFWGINVTVNPMNLIYIDNIINYFNTTYKNNLNLNSIISTSVCYGTWGLDATPQKLRQYMEEKFGRDHAIVKMLKSQPEVPGKFNKLIENMEYLDNARNLSHKDTFREVFKILG